MISSATISQTQIEQSAGIPAQAERQSILQRVQYWLYALALTVSVSVWFIAVRAPLWLDETVSFWQIHAGVSQIWSRQGLCFPAFSYILWFSSKIIGTSEIALRVPEILAMLGAVYLLYRAALEMFDRDVAIITAIVFCLHPIVIFASIDVRPYAFGALAINAAIFALVRLRHSNSNWMAALLGVAAACILYFHYLFAVILPALAICAVAFKFSDIKKNWRQLAIAVGAFAVAFLPVIPGLLYMFRTSGTHVVAESPHFLQLLGTMSPGLMPALLAGVLLAGVATRRLKGFDERVGWRETLLCVALALVPLLFLYDVSTLTSVHIFLPRYRLVAIPGIALCWGLFIGRIDSRTIRVLFCVALVSMVGYHYFSSPASRRHGYTWKYALAAAQKNAATDNAPVLICSDLPEADHQSMPSGAAVKDSTLLAPLTYYKVSVPVVVLPRALNDEAVWVSSNFLQQAAQRHQRFLAMGYIPSYGTLQWLATEASGTYYVRGLGTYDNIAVLEFTPRE